VEKHYRFSVLALSIYVGAVIAFYSYRSMLIGQHFPFYQLSVFNIWGVNLVINFSGFKFFSPNEHLIFISSTLKQDKKSLASSVVAL
jgi:hypothetical protein